MRNSIRTCEDALTCAYWCLRLSVCLYIRVHRADGNCDPAVLMLTVKESIGVHMTRHRKPARDGPIFRMLYRTTTFVWSNLTEMHWSRRLTYRLHQLIRLVEMYPARLKFNQKQYREGLLQYRKVESLMQGRGTKTVSSKFKFYISLKQARKRVSMAFKRAYSHIFFGRNTSTKSQY